MNDVNELLQQLAQEYVEQYAELEYEEFIAQLEAEDFFANMLLMSKYE